jgi:hypothetical protein
VAIPGGNALKMLFHGKKATTQALGKGTITCFCARQGSSRRIVTMRLRQAKIRRIDSRSILDQNCRRSKLPQLLLALPSKTGKNKNNGKNNPPMGTQ